MADATIQSILGTNIPKIIPPAARRLNSKVDRIRIPYIEKLDVLFKEHNIFERLQALSTKAGFYDVHVVHVGRVVHVVHIVGRTAESKHINNNPLAYEDTLNILDSRHSKSDEISADMIKIQANEKEETTVAEQLDKAKAAYVRTISSTKVPMYGVLRINNKDSEAIRFLS